MVTSNFVISFEPKVTIIFLISLNFHTELVSSVFVWDTKYTFTNYEKFGKRLVVSSCFTIK